MNKLQNLYRDVIYWELMKDGKLETDIKYENHKIFYERKINERQLLKYYKALIKKEAFNEFIKDLNIILNNYI